MQDGRRSVIGHGMARTVATLLGVLRMDDTDYKAKLSDARTETQNFAGTLKNQGENLQRFGAGMTAFFAPAGVALGYAITQTQTFDRTFSNINAILQLGTEEAAALRAEILAYGSGTVAGPQATAEAYYEIVSGVADASTHMAILTAATETAEAGQASLQGTTSALISTMNAYGFAASDATYVSDVFTRTVGMGVLSMDELAAAFPQVTGLGAQFGIGIDELGGSMAYLTAQGYSASQSATFMKSMMTTLLAPTADLQKTITALGYESGAAMLETLGLVGSYEALAAHNGGLDGLITNSEALNGSLVLTQDSAASFFDTYNSGIAGATAAAGAVQDGTEQWALLQSQLQGLAITVGSTLVPIINELITNYIVPAVAAVGAWITANPELSQQIVILTAGLVAAGPVIAGIGTAMTVMGAAIGFVTSPIGLVVVGLGALAAAYYTNFGGIRDYIDTQVVPVIQGLIDWLGRTWTDVQPHLENLYNWFVTTGLPGVVTYLETNVFPIITNFTGLISDIWTLVQPSLTTLYDWFMVTGLPAVIDFMNGPFTTAMNAIGGVVTGFLSNVNNAITAVRDLLGVSSSVPSYSGPGYSYTTPNADGSFGGASAHAASQPRAMGGPVSAGRSYLVGEREPELFVPHTDGQILNGQQMAALGGGGVQIGNVTIYANSYAEGQEAARGFDDELKNLKRSRGVT